MRSLLLAFLQIYLLVLFARAILSWFPLRPGGAAASVQSVLFVLTEPVLRPVRRIVPRTGVIDISFMVVFFGVMILQSVIARG